MKERGIYRNHPEFENLQNLMAAENLKLQFTKLLGSSYAMMLSALFEDGERPFLVLSPEKDDAAYLYNDLVNILSEDQVLFFPSSYKRSVQYGNIDNENVVLRTEVLNRIKDSEKVMIVSYPEALIERIISKEDLEKNTLQLKKGEKISIDFITDMLFEYQFEQVDFVYEPGQYAIRGSIVDIFSYSGNLPYRLDFFGDEVETIRTFDIESQLSKATVDKVSIVPNIQFQSISDHKNSLFDFLGKEYIISSTDLAFVCARMDQIFKAVETDFRSSEDEGKIRPEHLITGKYLQTKLEKRFVIESGSNTLFDNHDNIIGFDTSLQPGFRKNFILLGEELTTRRKQGYKNYILSSNPKQHERLESILIDIGVSVSFVAVNFVLHEGFADHDLKVCYYTDHQIFDRFHKYSIKKHFTRKDSITLRELSDLHPGDYVVHIDHGIGQFGGLHKIEVNGKMQESVRLIYRDNDVLFVNIHSLHRISKYRGKDGEPPKVYKLGTAAWSRLKEKTKSKVKDIAKDLILLYAKRRKEQGFQFSPDSYLSKELEASFIYEDTPDQEKATKAVKEDMEDAVPMDRLVCGDVGFGKTEVAIRAAFKAVADSKQVAILVPTTILALQHYTTFKERLKEFPCTIDYISRLKSSTQQRDSLKRLAAGEIDIMIGTHKLVGKDIKFKDLGLLVIDEEQKFGVSVKEKLKKIKLNVDTLTLTATPIPRTLQFSLMGARDLSIINTPPPNRHPIVTELHTFNEDIIRETISYELERGGQVFFINNRVQNIEEIKAMIDRMLPGIKTVTAHGQMDGPVLENIMLDFMAGDYDVLIATTIVENGLDIPNANTIIINNANHFGLSDLHQLRGRVGRSNKRAFCYLLAPPLTMMTPEARRRLRAIEEFSDLGSGFNIAMQDLDIRGAGNLLGAEQSGFISDIGFETYQRILNEALLELRETEFKDLFSGNENDNEKEPESEPESYVNDCVIDTDFEVLFPESYISNISERIRLYRNLDNIEEESALVDFEKQLIDRFGELPQQTKGLLNIVRLRRIAKKAGFEKLILKQQKFVGHFVANPESSYFKSSVFSRILQFVQKNPAAFRMQEKSDKLSLAVSNINSIQKAIDLLDKMLIIEQGQDYS